MQFKLCAIALVSVLAVAACGDDDPSSDGGSDTLDGSVEAGGGDGAAGSPAEEDSGAESDAGEEDAGR